MIYNMNKISHKLLLIILVVLIIAIFLIILNILNSNKINYGIKISGVSVGGLSKENALNEFSIASQNLFKENFNLIYKNSIWTVNLKNLGIEIDVAKTMDLAYEYGHQKNELFKNVWQQLRSFLGYNFKPISNIDDGKLEEFLEENLSSIHQPAKNSALTYDTKTQDLTITPSKSGIIIDKNKLRDDLINIVNNSKTTDINLSLINDEPAITESEVKKLIPEAEKLLENTPITVMANQKEIDKIDKDQLLNLMDPVPTLEDSKIENYLIFLSPLVAQEPMDAQLTVSGDRVTQFALSQEGVKLEIKDNIDILKNGILDGQKEINKIKTKIAGLGYRTRESKPKKYILKRPAT